MPLHSIPLCDFSYVGDTLSSATFKYDTREAIVTNNKTQLVYIEGKSKINKDDNIKGFYSDNIPIEKSSIKSFYSYNVPIVKNTIRSLYKSNSLLVKQHNKNFYKDKVKFVKNININRYMSKAGKITLMPYINSLELSIKNFKGLSLNENKNIEILTNRELTLNLSKEFAGHIRQIYKPNNFVNIKVEDFFRRIVVEKGKDLKSSYMVNISIIPSVVNLTRNKNLEINIEDNNISMTRLIKEKPLCITENSKILNINIIRNIEIKDTIISADRLMKNELFIFESSSYLNRRSVSFTNKIGNNKRMYKRKISLIEKRNLCYRLYRKTKRDTMNILETKPLKTYAIKNINKLNSIRELNYIKIAVISKGDPLLQLDKNITHEMFIIKNVSLRAIRYKKINLQRYTYSLNKIKVKKLYKAIDNNKALKKNHKKNINIANSIISLTRKENIHINVKNQSIMTNIIKNIKININSQGIMTNIINKTSIDIVVNNRILSANVRRWITINEAMKNVYKVSRNKISIFSDKYYLNAKANKLIIKVKNTKLAYKNKILSLEKNVLSYGVNNGTIRNIMRLTENKPLEKDTVKKLDKLNTKDLNDVSVKIISKYNQLLQLNKDSVYKIFSNNSISIKDISLREIKLQNLYGLNKPRINTFRIECKPSKKEPTIINKEFYFNALEVVKRWWILDATMPTDQKILPFYDYGYGEKPLFVNRRDREYGNLIEINKHPISYMPYLENKKGIDLHYGREEIHLSIEIMLDMVNIVMMIIKHSASQFANCSGQEAIEFIMEILLEWLNLDTTKTEMNRKGSREHYLRCYRWIRWEAEKVWFIADEDHSIDKMKGIKYVGMLFANLSDYMKYHHFNIVPLWGSITFKDIEKQFKEKDHHFKKNPLWGNLTYMDIERQFKRKSTNNDIMKDLDKFKEKRHYFIESQNLRRK